MLYRRRMERRAGGGAGARALGENPPEKNGAGGSALPRPAPRAATCPPPFGELLGTCLGQSLATHGGLQKPQSLQHASATSTANRPFPRPLCQSRYHCFAMYQCVCTCRARAAGGSTTVGDSMHKQEENNVRVTNLSEDTREDDLRVSIHALGCAQGLKPREIIDARVSH
jgi:hypothetical protein